MQEFLQIMENFGLYDEPGQEGEDDSQRAKSKSPSDQSGYSEKQNPAAESKESKQRKKPEKPLDLGLLDQKSVKIMVMLMLFLLENNLTTAEFFEPAIYQQNVKSKNKQQTLDILKAKDFFSLLQERGIRKKATEHTNLKEFLQLSPSFPDLLVVKSIRKTLEQMADNDDFMEAIREDIMAANDEQQQNEDDQQYEDQE